MLEDSPCCGGPAPAQPTNPTNPTNQPTNHQPTNHSGKSGSSNNQARGSDRPVGIIIISWDHLTKSALAVCSKICSSGRRTIGHVAKGSVGLRGVSGECHLLGGQLDRHQIDVVGAKRRRRLRTKRPEVTAAGRVTATGRARVCATSCATACATARVAGRSCSCIASSPAGMPRAAVGPWPPSRRSPRTARPKPFGRNPTANRGRSNSLDQAVDQRAWGGGGGGARAVRGRCEGGGVRWA